MEAKTYEELTEASHAIIERLHQLSLEKLKLEEAIKLQKL